MNAVGGNVNGKVSIHTKLYQLSTFCRYLMSVGTYFAELSEDVRQHIGYNLSEKKLLVLITISIFNQLRITLNKVKDAPFTQCELYYTEHQQEHVLSALTDYIRDCEIVNQHALLSLSNME